MGKVVEVSQAQAIWLIIRVLGCLENCGSFRGAQPVSDAYLVEIGIADEQSRLPCRSFQPTWPTRVCPGASKIGACTISP
jgi:hypothetical protein